MTPLFVELCAGTAALSLRLQGGNRCRPVVSRMGAKTGYANTILACFGLTPGGKAGAYLWCEPDPGARLLLQALPQPDVLREAASVLRGWASEDPRTLWEALRKEGPPKGCGGREVARHMICTGWTLAGGGRCVAPGAAPGVNPAVTLAGMGERIHTLPQWPPVTITEDARTVDPREVARTCYLICQSYDSAKAAAQGWTAGGCFLYAHKNTGELRHPPERIADRLCRLQQWPPVAVTSDAREIDPPRLPEGTIAYLDGPYEQTTGYGNLLPRAEQVKLARLWADAGAFVGVSEQVPIPELMADGWHAVRITNGRKGAARTFSRQSDEWLTLSRPPVNPPLLGSQEGLF